jgi:hypothetical protein
MTLSNLFENILSNASDSVKQSSERVADEKSNDEWKVTDEFLGYRKKRVADWRTPDFFHFFLDLFEKKFGEPFDIAPAAGQQSILLIKDAIAKELGERPSNQVVKDYLEWFMENVAHGLIVKYGCMKMKFFKASWEIERFLDLYSKIKNRKKPEKVSSILYTDDSMRAVYMSSPKNFVLKYGLVLSTVWLMRRNGMSEQEAVKIVTDHAIELTEEGKYNAILSATEKHCPYPRWCFFRSIDSMPRELTIETGQFFDVLSVYFSDHASQFLFLKDSRS